MPDGLYDRDILEWSERQSALLRRLASGERLNEEVDWPNVIEELEAVGRSELNACGSLLVQAVTHLMKLHLEPHSPAVPHWGSEVANFTDQAHRAFSPSMRHRIDMQSIYRSALRSVRTGALRPITLPASCPYVLDDLLADDLDLAGLVARLG